MPMAQMPDGIAQAAELMELVPCSHGADPLDLTTQHLLGRGGKGIHSGIQVAGNLAPGLSGIVFQVPGLGFCGLVPVH